MHYLVRKSYLKASKSTVQLPAASVRRNRAGRESLQSYLNLFRSSSFSELLEGPSKVPHRLPTLPCCRPRILCVTPREKTIQTVAQIVSLQKRSDLQPQQLYPRNQAERKTSGKILVRSGFVKTRMLVIHSKNLGGSKVTL